MQIQQSLEISTDQEKDIDRQSVIFEVLLPSETFIEKKQAMLDPVGNRETTKVFTPLEITKEKALESHNEILVESCEGSSLVILTLQDMAIVFEVFQECTKLFSYIYDKKEKQYTSISLKNDQLPHIEQSRFNQERYSCLFVDHQEKVGFHALEDPFSSLL